ncbi:hypothetical protein D3C77_635150 [compost metagenome]
MRSGNRHTADDDSPGPQLGNIIHLLTQLLNRVHNFLGMFNEAGSCVCNFDCTRITLEQLDAELLLELGQLLAERWLSDVELVSCPGKITFFSNF